MSPDRGREYIYGRLAGPRSARGSSVAKAMADRLRALPDLHLALPIEGSLVLPGQRCGSKTRQSRFAPMKGFQEQLLVLKEQQTAPGLPGNAGKICCHPDEALGFCAENH